MILTRGHKLAGSLLGFSCMYFLIFREMLSGEGPVTAARCLSLIIMGAGVFLMYPESTMIFGVIFVLVSIVVCIHNRYRISIREFASFALIPAGATGLALAAHPNTVKFALCQTVTAGSAKRQSWADYFDAYWLGIHEFTETDPVKAAVEKLLSLIPSWCGMYMITPDYEYPGFVVMIWLLAEALLCAALTGVFLYSLAVLWKKLSRKDQMITGCFLLSAIFGAGIFLIMVLSGKYWSAGKLLLYLMLAGGILSSILADIPVMAMLVPVALVILQNNKCEPGTSSFGRAMMVGLPFACLIGGVGTPAGSSMNAMTIGLLKDTANVNISFLDWTCVGMPIVFILIPIAWFFTIKAYPPEMDSLAGMGMVEQEYEKLGKEFDTLAVLQPTSPLRTCQDIRSAYRILEEKQADSVVGVCEVEHSPLWSNTLPEDGCLKGFIREDANGPRQKLSSYYRINGAVYIVSVPLLLKKGTLYGERGYACIMSKEHSIDIDDELDFAMAEFLLGHILHL